MDGTGNGEKTAATADQRDLQSAKHTLGRKLRVLRKARGLVQKDVAQRVFSTRSTARQPH